MYIYNCIIVILFKFVTATNSFVLNVAGDLPDLQAPPQPSSIRNKNDRDRTELDHNNNKNKNKNNDNNTK